MDPIRLCSKCLLQRSPLEIGGCPRCGTVASVTLEQALTLLNQSAMVQNEAIKGLTTAVGQMAMSQKAMLQKLESLTSGGLVMPPSARGLPR